jgi:hypothetical protein
LFLSRRFLAIRSSETSVLTRATRRHIPEDGILHEGSCCPTETGTPSLSWSNQSLCRLLYPGSVNPLVLVTNWRLQGQSLLFLEQRTRESNTAQKLKKSICWWGPRRPSTNKLRLRDCSCKLKRETKNRATEEEATVTWPSWVGWAVALSPVRIRMLVVSQAINCIHSGQWWGSHACFIASPLTQDIAIIKCHCNL